MNIYITNWNSIQYALLALFYLLETGCRKPPAETSEVKISNPVNSADLSIVILKNSNDDLNKLSFYSGVLIAPNVAISILPDKFSSGPINTLIFVGPDNKERFYSVKLHSTLRSTSEPTASLAIYEIATPIEIPKYPKFDLQELQSGDKVNIVGFGASSISRDNISFNGFGSRHSGQNTIKIENGFAKIEGIGDSRHCNYPEGTACIGLEGDPGAGVFDTQGRLRGLLHSFKLARCQPNIVNRIEDLSHLQTRMWINDKLMEIKKVSGVKSRGIYISNLANLMKLVEEKPIEKKLGSYFSKFKDEISLIYDTKRKNLTLRLKIYGPIDKTSKKPTSEKSIDLWLVHPYFEKSGPNAGIEIYGQKEEEHHFYYTSLEKLKFETNDNVFGLKMMDAFLQAGNLLKNEPIGKTLIDLGKSWGNYINDASENLGVK